MSQNKTITDFKQSSINCAEETPLFPDVGIIALVPDHWNEVWQSRNHVLTRLSKYFNVLWFGPMRDRRELFRRLFGGPTAQEPAAVISGSGFQIYKQDWWLPKLYRPRRLARFTFSWQLRRASAALRARGAKKIILYIWRPKFGNALDLIDYDLSLYHIDDEYSFSKNEEPISEVESKLLSRVDQVFIHSPALMKKKGRVNPNTILIPNGVDYHEYAKPVDEPDDIKHVPKPRIGYVGRIKWTLDLDLLWNLATNSPEWHFVMVGPVVPHGDHLDKVSQLKSLDNVHFLGGKPASALPGYVQYLDVCLLCYLLNDYTRYIYPIKLHEYLAAGKPVVASPIRSLEEFHEVITLSNTVEEWKAAIQSSLQPSANSPQQIKLRQDVARQFDWDILVHKIATTICRQLGPSYLSRIDNKRKIYHTI